MTNFNLKFGNNSDLKAKLKAASSEILLGIPSAQLLWPRRALL